MSENWDGPPVAPPAPPARPTSEGRALELLAEVAMAAVTERRRARRWSLFFRFLWAGLFAALAFGLIGRAFEPDAGVAKRGRYTAVVNVEGLIADGTEASADNVLLGLRRALQDSATAGVILAINSPGGSPVQAGQMFDEILRLRAAHPKIPVYAVIADAGASGGYYVAAAAQSIYADKASIVGSIGVRADGFGFVGTLDKLGVERRLLTAGANKALLDPFSPQRPEQVAFMQGLLDQIHRQFIDAVRKGRGARLQESAQVFSGLVWTGEQAVGLGLVDGLGSVRSVARDVIGVEQTRDFTHRERVVEHLLGRVEAASGRVLARVLGLDPPLQ